jgi:hypothetical protein
MPTTSDTESTIKIPGTSSHFLDPAGPDGRGEGQLRCLTGGTGPPLVLLHTVRTQAEHFRHLIPPPDADPSARELPAGADSSKKVKQYVGGKCAAGR